MFPVLLKAGPFTLYTFGVMVILGAFAGLSVGRRLARAKGLRPELIDDLGYTGLFSGVVGARLLFIALNWQKYAGNAGEMLSFWRGGLSFHGGLALAILAVYVHLRLVRQAVAPVADIAAPVVAIGMVFGRIGCFLNGCCYGFPTDLPWACRFPDEHAPATLTPPSHPTQLYETILNVLMAVALVRLNRTRLPAGAVGLIGLLLFAVDRFIIEHFRRGATAEVLLAGLTEAQVASIVLFIVAGIWLALRLRHSPAARPTSSPTSPQEAPASPSP
jgi:phosphatidylglycerol---prolipoprotein diacylglyceryl transferase